MKKHFQRLALALLICFALPQRSQGEVGNNNPTGVAGEYNGSITTAGSYDPYTGNGKRSVDDLTVTGSLGAYPLKWTRILNTRFPAWSNGYNWSLWIRRPDTQLYIPPYDGRDGCVSYPDGRTMDLWLDGESSYAGGGGEFGDRLVSTGGDNYDFLMSDGGRIRFVNTNPGAEVILEYVATEIIDPYGLTTLLQHDAAGRLWKIIEPGQRFLQINYDARSVQAFDGRGNLIETVTYIFQPLTIAGFTGSYLTQVQYDDGTAATFTYQPNNIWAAHSALIETCHDPRYAGVMKDIKYEFVTFAVNPNPVVGQVWKEKSATTGQTVSEMIYPGPAPADQLQRREIRGDGATRLFQYDGWGKLASYSDFEGHVSRIRLESPGQNSDHYFKILTDGRNYETKIKKDEIAGAVWAVTRGTTPPVIYDYTDPNNPYYLKSKTDENAKTTYYDRNPINGNNANRIWKIRYPDDGFETFTYDNNPLAWSMSIA